jgi:Mrp family chromosome partitioning ATPase
MHPTRCENLWLVPAGRCTADTIRLLRRESTASLLKELATQSDYLIIDSSPVLLAADTGYICRHVDGVLLAVRRDVSQLEQVRLAQQFVERLGCQILGAVVTESAGAHHFRDNYYASKGIAMDQTAADKGETIPA